MQLVATNIAHDQMFQQTIDSQDIVVSVNRGKDNLMLQVKTLQNINLNLQWQLANLQSRKSVTCGHIYQCGCGMTECNNCTIIQQCDKCNDEVTYCDWCNRSPKLCNDQLCVKYYERRFDNCDCQSMHCNFCSARINDKIK